MENLEKAELRRRTNGMYYIEFVPSRQRVSCHTRDEAEARARMTEALAKLAGASRITVRVLLKHCRTVEDKRGGAWKGRKAQATLASTISILNRYIGDVPIETITYGLLQDLIAQFQKERTTKGKPLAPATINRRMTVLSSALSLATRMQYASGDPWLAAKPSIPKLEQDNFQDRVVEKDEQGAIFAAIDRRREAEPDRDWYRFGCAIHFLLWTACRRGEVLGLRDHHIRTFTDPSSGDTFYAASIPSGATKNGDAKTITLPVELYPLIPPLIEMARDPASQPSPSRRGGRPRANPRTATLGRLFPFDAPVFWHMWATIRADVTAMGFDVADVKIHTMRHTALSDLARANVPMEKIADFAGHRNAHITRTRYAHLRVQDGISTAATLSAYRSGTSNPPPPPSDEIATLKTANAALSAQIAALTQAVLALGKGDSNPQREGHSN